MLVRLLYAELPRPSFGFVAREPGIYEWAAVRRPILSFADQEKIQPKLEWGAVRRPDLLFASMPRPAFEFVPFDVELYMLVQEGPPAGYVFVSRAGRLVTYTGRKVIFEAAA